MKLFKMSTDTGIQSLIDMAYEMREVFQKRSQCNNFHMAILYKGNGRVEHIGVNKPNATYKTPLHCLLTIHAEMDAINGLLRGYNPEKVKGFKRQNMKILVIRFTKSGLLANSEPCLNCIEKMKELGIKKVSWSTDERTIESGTPSTLLTNGTKTISSGNRPKIYDRLRNGGRAPNQ